MYLLPGHDAPPAQGPTVAIVRYAYNATVFVKIAEL